MLLVNALTQAKAKAKPPRVSLEDRAHHQFLAETGTVELVSTARTANSLMFQIGAFLQRLQHQQLLGVVPLRISCMHEQAGDVVQL